MTNRWARAATWIAAGLCALLASLLSPAARAADTDAACLLPELRTNEAPMGDDGTVDVSVSFGVLDVMGVKDVTQQIDIDLLIHTHWVDPRLEGLAGCRFQVAEVWSPQVRLINSSNLRQAFINARNQVVVSEGGQVTHVQRGTGEISSYHSLRQFPFDNHSFVLRFAAQTLDDYQVRFIPDAERTWIANRLNIEGWQIGDVSIWTDDFVLHDGAEPFPTINLTIPGEREPEFFIYRVLVLLFLVVGMSWVIFWVPPSRFEFQIGIGATAMLTAIAFNLALSGQLPPVGYLTTLDRMMIWAILLVFLSIMEALLAGRMVMKGREAAAIRIDRACRIVFPVLLIGGWMGIVLVT